MPSNVVGDTDVERWLEEQAVTGAAAVRDKLGDAADAFVRRAQATAPVRTGLLRSRISWIEEPSVRDGREILAGQFGPSYARFVAGGTRAHEVKPRTAQALKVAGHFYADVTVSGVRATHYIDRAFEEVLPEMLAIVDEAL